MSEVSNRRFVHFNGTKDEFIDGGYPDQYQESIVFINGDGNESNNTIYTHGEYYGQGVIVEGDASNSAVLKGEYENVSNRALSQTSMAVGAGTTAGLKGWYYSNIEFGDNPVIKLSESQPIAAFGGLSGGSWSLGTPTNIAVGDKVSIVNNSKYDYCGEVKSISVNKITLKSTLPFNKLDIGTGIIVNNPDDWSIYIPDKPDAGIIDFGGGAFSEGVGTKSTNIGSHAEGILTHAYGQYSHAEGFKTEAGYVAHAEGRENIASGNHSHAEGLGTISQGASSHAEGCRTTVDGVLYNTISIGVGSHAEGTGTTSSGSSSHSEGYLTVASGSNSHAEGKSTKAIGPRSHSEGNSTTAEGNQSHSEGYNNYVYGTNSHAEGSYNTMLATASHIEGSYNTDETISQNNHIEGNLNLQSDSSTETIPNRNEFTNIKGINHVEGAGNVISLSSRVHVEGSSNIINGVSDCHIEGRNNTLNNELNTNTRGSHVEGYNNKVCCNYAHAQGKNNIAFGEASFVTGIYNRTNNAGEASFGKYNDSSKKTLFSIGNGTSDAERYNLIEARTDDNIYLYVKDMTKLSGDTVKAFASIRDLAESMCVALYDKNGNIIRKKGNNTITCSFDCLVSTGSIYIPDDTLVLLKTTYDTSLTDYKSPKLNIISSTMTHTILSDQIVEAPTTIYYLSDLNNFTVSEYSLDHINGSNNKSIPLNLSISVDAENEPNVISIDTLVSMIDLNKAKGSLFIPLLYNDLFDELGLPLEYSLTEDNDDRYWEFDYVIYDKRPRAIHPDVNGIIVMPYSDHHESTVFTLRMWDEYGDDFVISTAAYGPYHQDNVVTVDFYDNPGVEGERLGTMCVEYTKTEWKNSKGVFDVMYIRILYAKISDSDFSGNCTRFTIEVGVD